MDVTPPAEPIRVLVVDDHAIVRRGLRGLLETVDDIEVVGEAATVEQARSRIPPTRPDVAILDVRVPDGNGIEVCREIRSSVGTNCLMLTSYSDDEALFEAIMAGASGYMLKQIRGQELLDAVKRVAAGESLTGNAAAQLRQRIQTEQHPGHERDDLGVGRGDVAELVLQGQAQRILDRLALGDELPARRLEALTRRGEIETGSTALALQAVDHAPQCTNKVRARLQALEFFDLSLLGEQDNIGNRQGHARRSATVLPWVCSYRASLNGGARPFGPGALRTGRSSARTPGADGRGRAVCSA